jgi:hypothetical protein
MKTDHRFIRGALAAIAVACAATSLYAQATSGNLVGTIMDASAAGIPDATVEARNVVTNITSTAKANSKGEYRINNLLVGRYDITAKANGFNTATSANIPIQLNATETVNLTLQVGQLTQSMEVREAAAVIDTTTAQVQNTFDSRDAVDLPQASYTGSNQSLGVYNLSLLNAGVTSNTGLGNGRGPSVGGQRPQNNDFEVEGVDINDKGVTGPVVYVPNDAVGQFSILQNQFAPEFGFSSGGIFNTVIKSGGNTLHGSLYEYLQNRNLNAVDQQTARQGFTSNPRFDDNRLGATLGGPIVKNKLFYFGNFEYNPIGLAPAATNVIYAPTAAGYSTLAGIPGVSKSNLGVLQKFLSPAPVATTTTPVGQNPNVAGSRAVDIPIGPISVLGPSFSNQYNVVAGGDWNISKSDQFRIRYIYNKLDEIDTTASLPIFWGTSPDYRHLATVSEFHNFGASATNELRLSYSRRNSTFVTPNYSYPGLDVFPNIIIEQDLNLQLGPNQNAPQGYIQNTYQIADNFTKLLGHHTIKVGYDFHDIIASNIFIQRLRGDYDYTNLNQFLLDLAPDSQGQRSAGSLGGVPVGFLQHAWFVNDDFRIRPNLTINLGLRYEYLTVPVASRAQKYNSAADVPGLIQFREPKSSKNDWAPRIGLAYSPGTSGRTSIRAGFGISYDQFYNNLAINEKPPYYQATYTSDPTSNSPNFLANGGLPNILPPPSNNPATARANTASYTFDQIRPYSINWTLGVQHVFMQDYTLEVRYTGTRGVHLYVQEQPNRIAPVTAQNSLPTFLSAPSAGQLAGLSTTLGQLRAIDNNPWSPYGFSQLITTYNPRGDSSYHGLGIQLTRRFTRNFSLNAAYTWSHNIDNATAVVNSTALTPRRGQDFYNLNADRASSLLDRRQRLSLTGIYDVAWFKNGNWFRKNIIGNWTISGTYTYESPEMATIQSGIDSNLNGDTAGDRVIVNPSGDANAGSGVYGVDRLGNRIGTGNSTNAAIVAYVATNPNARYVAAGLGAYPNAGRNTYPLSPIDNIDAALSKRFNISERMKLQFSAQAFNLLNHPQFIPGFVSDLTPQSYTGAGRSFLIPGNAAFGHYQDFFPSNARIMQVVAKFTF